MQESVQRVSAQQAQSGLPVLAPKGADARDSHSVIRPDVQRHLRDAGSEVAEESQCDCDERSPAVLYYRIS